MPIRNECRYNIKDLEYLFEKLAWWKNARDNYEDLITKEEDIELKQKIEKNLEESYTWIPYFTRKIDETLTRLVDCEVKR